MSNENNAHEANGHGHETNRDLGRRWTPAVAAGGFTPVPMLLLQSIHLLPAGTAPGARCLNSTETMVLIQLLSHKWDNRDPFPALTTIAARMGLSTRAVRAAVKTLEGAGYLQRQPTYRGGSNRYDLSGLFAVLEEIQQARKADQTEEAA